jgi:hypothetical protein
MDKGDRFYYESEKLTVQDRIRKASLFFTYFVPHRLTDDPQAVESVRSALRFVAMEQSGGGQGGEGGRQTAGREEITELRPEESQARLRRSSRNGFRFDVALSFPGERRTYVEEVANVLTRELGKKRVLYDRNFEAELARLDLDAYLQRLYHDESELIAVFLCKDYEKKEWCGLEWRAIRDLIKKREHKGIVLLRFDETPILGVFSTDGYIDLRSKTPDQTAQLIRERLLQNRTADQQ